jgi:tripartite-type tricarboxylate transporter receptor subunit TctC
MKTVISYLRTICLIATSLALHPAGAQERFPSKPVKLVIPYAPGGLTDVFARGLAQHLSQKWKESVIVENKPGGVETIAALNVASAAADGHTLLLASDAAFVVNGLIKKSLPYDPKTAFTPITRMAEGPGVLVVNPSMAAKNLKEYLNVAKQSPGKVTYGVEGVGVPAEFRMRAFSGPSEKYQFNQIPYNGSGPVLNDLLGGRLDSAWLPPHLAKIHSEAKKVIPIAISGTKRSPLLPEVPTIQEQGFTTVDVSFKMMLAGPARVPASISKKIAADVGSILRDPEFQQSYLRNYGYTVIADTPEEFGRYLESARARLWSIVSNENMREQ